MTLQRNEMSNSSQASSTGRKETVVEKNPVSIKNGTAAKFYLHKQSQHHCFRTVTTFLLAPNSLYGEKSDTWPFAVQP